jgi:preprotein translocase subunit SecF
MEQSGGEEKKRNFIYEIYDKKYKALLIIPIILLVLAIVQIGYQITTTGDFLNKGVTLKGGLSISISREDIDIVELQGFLMSKFSKADINVRALTSAAEQIGVIVEASDVEANDLILAIEDKIGALSKDEYTVEVTGGSLGASFFKDTFKAVIIAFILMSIVVFAYFRIPIPSIAVIICAVCDILETLAIVNLLGIKLSTAGIAAFLMLIGYSVDTDILLTIRVLKRKEGTVLDGVISAIKTGMTMSITTIVAVVVCLIFAQSDVLKQIMTILLIGLLLDLINTWIQNAGILRWYMEKHHRTEDWKK